MKALILISILLTSFSATAEFPFICSINAPSQRIENSVDAQGRPVIALFYEGGSQPMHFVHQLVGKTTTDGLKVYGVMIGSSLTGIKGWLSLTDTMAQKSNTIYEFAPIHMRSRIIRDRAGSKKINCVNLHAVAAQLPELTAEAVEQLKSENNPQN